MRLVGVLWVLALCCSANAAIPSGRQDYVPATSSCDGFPRAAIEMAPGLCAGLVLAPKAATFHQRKLKTPRMLLQLQDDSRWLVTDLGGWTAGQGKIWLLEAKRGEEAHLSVALSGLTLPHTISTGPDGHIYVAEMNRIFRFDPATGTAVTVVDGLPGNRLHIGRHPLSHFVFDGNGDLLVNVGADTDQCADAAKSPGGVGCPEANGDDARAVIRRYPYLGDGRWDQRPTIVARGLRNSLVLLRHSSGTLLQAENSYDFAPAADRPYDEINVIRNGAHYGWPYCYDIDRATPAWASVKAMDCGSSAHEKPVSLLPPHAAPLGAIYYQGAMFDSLRGKLLMSWHGYRPTGSRIVAFDVDSKGVPVPVTQPTYPKYLDAGGVASEPYRASPAAMPTVLTPGWDLKVGARPAGAPVGISVARDGALWVADDRNAAIVRIATDRP